MNFAQMLMQQLEPAPPQPTPCSIEKVKAQLAQGPRHTVEIARALGVSNASAGRSLGVFKRKGFLNRVQGSDSFGKRVVYWSIP